MNRISRTAIAAVTATVTLGAAAIAPAGAQVDVDVAVDNVGGSRALHVEDLAGQSLSELDFGNARSLPFRVRVVDTTMDRTGFSVSASMTNLYFDDGGSLDFDDAITSDNVSVDDAADPLNVQDPQVLVEPVYDTVSTITDSTICSTLSLVMVGGACTINAGDITGELQTVDLPVDLNDLSGLPLLPQDPQNGAFTNPSFDGVGASDPAASGAPAATSYQLISGSAVSDATVLTNVESRLNTLLSGLTVTQKIDSGVLTSALRSVVGVTWDLLTSAQVTTVVNSTTATLQSLTGADLLAQAGTYLSFPELDLTVPDGASGGTYRGTLVVTGLE